jgi:FMN phosphatase YigB (HAD superfamily)
MVKLIVFDFDDTITYHDIYYPFQVRFYLFEDTIPILEYLKNKGYLLAIASFNSICENILKEFNLDSYFITIQGKHISSKKELFYNIKNITNIDYHEWYFFDDNIDNILLAKSFGIISYLVNPTTGITLNEIKNLNL